MPGQVQRLAKNMVSIKVLRTNRMKISIQGHPNDCIEGAHALFSVHFKAPWHFVSILTRSPMERGKTFDDQWLFTIDARTKYD